jgi:small-conductance mechanosensitive channel
MFDFVWDEIAVPVAYRSDYTVAERIMIDEAKNVSSTGGAREALRRMSRRHPIPKADIEPLVFIQATSNYARLSVRFIIPVRMSRAVKDAMTRRILERFHEAGIEVGLVDLGGGPFPTAARPVWQATDPRNPRRRRRPARRRAAPARIPSRSNRVARMPPAAGRIDLEVTP